MGREGDRLAPLVLDAAPLIAFERGEERVRALLRKADAEKVELIVPSGALAQAWRSRRQARLSRLLGRARVEALDEPRGRACGELLARARSSDVVDAQVALCALEHRAGLVTGDADDLHALAPGLDIHPL